MATYVLIHGAGDGGWYWHLLEAELHDRGHDVVAPDLPSDDDAAGLAEYADTVDDWWANTGYAQARREHDERNGARRTTSPSSSMTSPRTWPPRRCAGVGTSRPPGQPAVAAPGVAGRAHQVPALPRRPLLPRRLPPPGGAGPPGPSPRTRSTAATASPSAALASWPTAWSRSGPSCRAPGRRNWATRPRVQRLASPEPGRRIDAGSCWGWAGSARRR